MKCPACGDSNPEDAAFCGECGAPLHTGIACGRCGRGNPPEKKFCAGCGAALLEAEPSSHPAHAATAEPKSPHPTSLAGGRYTVKRFLGEGGKKRVYLVHDTRLDRDVAFALIKTEGLDMQGLQRIQREAQAMAKLGDHPHVVPVFDIGEENGAPYLVSQFMGGGDVEGLIKKAEDHRLPLPQILKITSEVCQALEYAHKHGVVHRDLKPGNVWLTAPSTDSGQAPSTGSGQVLGTAKLGDFGLAVVKDRSRLTQEGMMVGTVSYMPPEQALGGKVDGRSDLYSLGAMLYEMVTGRTPFVGDDSVAIITQHLNIPPVVPSWHRVDLPASLEALILRLLEKDPAKRPASAAEVRQILSAIDLSAVSSAPAESRVGRAETGAAIDSPLYRRAFVGREEELRQLKAAFDRAISGHGGLAMVVGEPGIGKTALCEQLATYAAVRGGRTLVGHCYEEGSFSLPYLPFVEALRSYVLVREPEDLKRELGTGAAEVARIVSEIRDRVAVEPRPPGDPEDDCWRLLQAVTVFLRNAAVGQPMLLVLEDLHWAGRGTLDLLIHLARNLQGARLLLVGTYRDIEVDRAHPLSAALAELRRLGDLVRVVLRGLTPDEVHRMINAISGQEARWSLAETVHRQTEGNPLFVQEVLRYLVEEGLIRREGGRWRRAGDEVPEMSIPEGLRDVIGKRLSKLSPDCNRLLSIAAVIGRDFRLETLQSVAGVSEEQVVTGLEEATRVSVLEEQTRPGMIRYRFAHAFFRQTLYEELSAPRRLRLHQEVARALERQYAARLEEHAAELAEHFAQSTDAADLEKAVHYSELAARRAMAVYAYGEAARLLEQALEVQEVLDPDDRLRRCDLLLALGEALSPAGEPQRAAEQVATEALRLAEAMGDDMRAARVCELAVEALHRHGGPFMVLSDVYLNWAEHLDRYAEPNTRARAYADCILASVRRPRGQYGVANALVLRSLQLARRLDDPEVLFRAAASMMFQGWPPRYQQEQRRMAYEITDRPRHGVRTTTLALVLHRAQTLFLAAGDRARAEQVWRELNELATHTRDVAALLWPLQLEAIRATLDGELEGAVEAASRLKSRAIELGIPIAGELSAVWLRFHPLLYLGHELETLLGELRQFTRTDLGPLQSLIPAHQGRSTEALAEAQRGLARFRSLAAAGEAPTWGLSVLLEVAVMLGDTEIATFTREQLQGLVAIGLRDLVVFNVARHLGGAAVLLGDREDARAEYERSLSWAVSIRHRPEIALTRLRLAELLLKHYPKEKPEALQHLDFAIGEFRAMKMEPALKRALQHKSLLTA